MGPDPIKGNGNGAKVVVPGAFAGLNLNASVEDELVDMLKRYIAGRHCSSIGQAFDVYTEGGRERCARWLASMFIGALGLEV